jgi:hypothetical protein
MYDEVLPKKLRDKILRELKGKPAKSLKHGDHDQSDHGSWATGGGVLARNADKFKEAGGKTTSHVFKTEAAMMKKLVKDITGLHKDRDGIVKAIHAQEDKGKDAAALYRKKLGIDLLQKALQPQEDYSSNTRVLISRGPDGKMCGALSYYEPQGEPFLTVQFLGSTQDVSGTGTALMREAMQIALDGNKTFAVLEPIEDARTWYESLGLGEMVFDRRTNSKYYEVGPDALKEILGSPVKSIKHGDHDQSEHGNWATGGGFSKPNAEDVRRTKINAMFSKTTEPMYWVNGSAQSRDQTFLALDAYTHWNPGDGGNPFHHELNDALRSGSSISKASKDVAAKYGDSDDPEDVKKMRGDLFSGFREVDQLLKESKMIEDTAVLRQSTFVMTADGWANVVSGGPLEIYGMTIEPGAVISDSGYVSTSSDTSGQSTQYFGANFPPGTSYSQDNAPVSVKWDITVPKGAPALDLKALGYSSNHGEGEILLPRNTHFRIDSYEAMPQTMPGAPGQLKVSATVVPTHYP